MGVLVRERMNVAEATLEAAKPHREEQNCLASFSFRLGEEYLFVRGILIFFLDGYGRRIFVRCQCCQLQNSYKLIQYYEDMYFSIGE